MLRWISLSFLALGLMAPAAHAVEVAAPASQTAEAAAPVKTRTSCDSYGRCFNFSGPNDTLAIASVSDGSSVSETSSLWHLDPLALAHGTAGDPIEDLADD